MYEIHPLPVGSQTLMKWNMGPLLTFFSPKITNNIYFLEQLKKPCTMFPNTYKIFSTECHDTSPVLILPQNTWKMPY